MFLLFFASVSPKNLWMWCHLPSDYWVKVKDEADFCGYLWALTCTSRRSKYTTYLGEGKARESAERKRFDPLCRYNFTLILCVSVSAATFVWRAYTYTIDNAS